MSLTIEEKYDLLTPENKQKFQKFVQSMYERQKANSPQAHGKEATNDGR